MSGLTLQELRDSSKVRANMVNSGFIQDADWNTFVNEACSELHDLILQSDPKSIITIYQIQLQSNQQFYNLPPDFYKLEAVYRTVGGIRYSVDRADYHTIGQGLAVLANVVVGGSPYMYALVGNQIYFVPAQMAANPVEIWYYPAFTRLVNDTDTLDYPVINGWEQFVIVATALKAKMAEGNQNITAEAAEKAEVGNRIVEMANKRDEWEPPKYWDAYGSTSRNRRYNAYNPYQNLPYRFYR